MTAETSQVAQDGRIVRVIVPKYTTVHIRGIPVELAADAIVEIHPANVPLAFDEPFFTGKKDQQ